MATIKLCCLPLQCDRDPTAPAGRGLQPCSTLLCCGTGVPEGAPGSCDGTWRRGGSDGMWRTGSSDGTWRTGSHDGTWSRGGSDGTWSRGSRVPAVLFHPAVLSGGAHSWGEPRSRGYGCASPGQPARQPPWRPYQSFHLKQILSAWGGSRTLSSR